MGLKVCQPGNPDWGLPQWCIEQEITPEFILQGVVELVIVVVILGFFYLRWKHIKKEEADRIARENADFPKIKNL